MKPIEIRLTPKYITSGRLYKTKQYLYTPYYQGKTTYYFKVHYNQNGELTQTTDIENEQPEVLRMRG